MKITFKERMIGVYWAVMLGVLVNLIYFTQNWIYGFIFSILSLLGYYIVVFEENPK